MIDTGFAFNLFHYTDHEILNAIILIDLHFQTHSYNETKVIMKRNTGLLRSETKSFKNLVDDLLVKLPNLDARETESFVSLSGNSQHTLTDTSHAGCTGYIHTLRKQRGILELLQTKRSKKLNGYQKIQWKLKFLICVKRKNHPLPLQQWIETAKALAWLLPESSPAELCVLLCPRPLWKKIHGKKWIHFSQSLKNSFK